MLSLTTTSTRPWFSSLIAWVKPSTASTLAPASRATWAQLLVAFSAATLPFRSASDLIELSSARVTMTPSPTEYGSDRSYLAWRSGLIVTSLATTSNRLASSAANIESHGVSTNSTLHAELFADRLGDVDVVAGELAGGRVVVAERGVDALGADAQHAGRLHLVLAGRAAARRVSSAASSTSTRRPRRMYMCTGGP